MYDRSSKDSYSLLAYASVIIMLSPILLIVSIIFTPVDKGSSESQVEVRYEQPQGSVHPGLYGKCVSLRFDTFLQNNVCITSQAAYSIEGDNLGKVLYVRK